MSTRANIKLVDGKETLWFYRHSDGYPKVALELLTTFMGQVAKGEFRDNLSQAGGWLVVLGHHEYALDRCSAYDGMRWKVGSIEPTTGKHGDIEYLYRCDLAKKEIKVYSVAYKGRDKLLGTMTFCKNGWATAKGALLKEKMKK